MKFSSALAAVLASTSAATAAPSVPRQTEISVWAVTNFFASGARFSIATTYEFDISDGSLATHCVASVSTEPEILYVPLTNCTDSVYSFFFEAAPNSSANPGYNLQVWEENPQDTICGAPETKCVYTGVYFFPESDVVTVVDPSDPNGDYEMLDAPADFTITYVGTHI